MKTFFAYVSILSLSAAVAPATASVLRFENDYSGFVAAAGATRLIDFDSFPNGQPATTGTFVTSTFNFDNWGVHFSANVGTPRIGGDQSGHDLLISTPGQRNWLIADLSPVTNAVGIFYGGGTWLSIYDSSNNLIATRFFNSGQAGAERFLGFVSDVPIAHVTIDRLTDFETINDFVLAVPEPATLSLLAIGLSGVLLRRRRSSCLH